VGIGGPAGIREIDVILDTGAVYTVIAWDVAKDIGYDPAISERRTPIITATGFWPIPGEKLVWLRLVRIGSGKGGKVRKRNKIYDH